MKTTELNELIELYSLNPNDFLKRKDEDLKKLINLLIFFYQKQNNLPRTKSSAFTKLYLDEIYNKKDYPFYYEKVLINFLNGEIKNKEIEPFIYKNKKKNLLFLNGILIDLITEKPYKREIETDKLISLIEKHIQGN
jgi:hypothetical protein